MQTATSLAPGFVMNDIVPVYAQTRTIMQKMGLAVCSRAAFKTEFHGHETYQIRKFLFNDKDYPTAYAKYRQSCRELWARIEAAIQNRYNYEKAGAEISLYEADIAALEGWWKRLTVPAPVREARIRLAVLEIENRKAIRAQLQIQMEERIVRESAVILEIHAECARDADVNIEKDQAETWEARAVTEPRLKELVNSTGGNGHVMVV